MGLAKTIVMGMRVAFVMAPRPEDANALIDRFGKMSMWFVAALQAELAQAFITNGVAYEAAKHIRDVATSRRKMIADILHRPELADRPRALHLWVPTRTDAGKLAAEALSAGVLVRPGFQFAATTESAEAMQGLRVSFCETRSEDDLCRAAEVLARILSR